jgi:hypothetical protein
VDRPRGRLGVSALRHRFALAAGAALLLALGHACRGGPASGTEPARWWKGNTHTHTLWSDGNAPPERVVKWYRDRGYRFLVLSDHHVLSRGEAWRPVGAGSRLGPANLEAAIDDLGEGVLDLREGEAGAELRLATLDELRARYEAPGEFLLIEGEELTSSAGALPVHVNGLNLAEAIPAQVGASAVEVMNKSVAAVHEQGRRLERPVLAHVNHPNFRWGLTWADIAHLEGDRFFEVYNGHPGTADGGDGEHPSTERIWDLALTLRLGELGLEPLYGVATDDAHDFFEWGPGRVNPGRGWIMVRASELSAASLIAAMGRGDFYASSGVELSDVRFDGRRYEVEIEAEPGASYTTRFVGTRMAGDAPGEAGEVLLATRANPARYDCRGDELYVRAVVISSRLHPRPRVEGELEMAWTQPRAPAAPDR